MMMDAEKETVISFDRESDTMRIYTADSVMMNRLSKLKAYKMTRERKNGGRVVSREYEADKHLLTLRSKRVISTMTDEQKQNAAERLKKMREGK